MPSILRTVLFSDVSSLVFQAGKIPSITFRLRSGIVSDRFCTRDLITSDAAAESERRSVRRESGAAGVPLLPLPPARFPLWLIIDLKRFPNRLWISFYAHWERRSVGGFEGRAAPSLLFLSLPPRQCGFFLFSHGGKSRYRDLLPTVQMDLPLFGNVGEPNPSHLRGLMAKSLVYACAYCRLVVGCFIW